jgi:shikimate kinase
LMNIVLIGYRGSGKSEVGRRLASRLQMNFVDTDDLIQNRHGMTISRMVETHGWGHFRALEKEMISAIADRDQQVIAAGGGMILDPDNVAALRKGGLILWLKADRDTLLERMATDPRTPFQRPSLTGGEAREELEEVLTFRNPFYEEAAEAGLDTSLLDVEAVVEQVLSIIRERRGRP